MFCGVVSKVFCAWAPVYDRVALADTVCDSVEMHVHCSGAALADCCVDDTFCCCIVNLDGGWRLGVIHFF